MVLVFTRIAGERFNENQEYALLQYMEVTDLIAAVEQTTGCVCQRCSSKDEVTHILRQVPNSLKHQCLSMVERFGTERLQTIQGFLDVFIGNHAF